MRTIDFSPLYRTAIGFDHLASLLDSTIRSEQKRPSYPPYNIELTGEDKYRISMAIAGFDQYRCSATSVAGACNIFGAVTNHECLPDLYGMGATRF